MNQHINKEEFIQINSFKVRNESYYLHDPNGRQVIHTTIRKDFHKYLLSLSKRKHKPMSKILDCIIITFNNHPEIMKDFLKTLRNY